MSGCTSRKRQFETYGEALEALTALAESGNMRGPFGEIYQCRACDSWHISSKILKMVKPKGRGKKRKRVVREYEEGA